ISPRVKTIRVRKVLQMFGISPFLGRVFAGLHQTDFSDASARVWTELALAPDHGFDQCRFNIVTSGRGADRLVLTVLQASLPPPISCRAAHENQEENRKRQPPFHPNVLPKPVASRKDFE